MAIPGGLTIGGGAILVIMAAGAGVGSWMGSMVALDIPNSRHRDFQEAVDKGEVLMLIDVPKDRVEEIERLVLDHHPEAELERAEARILEAPPGY
jgi:glutamate synthase domain-containing protein 3